MPAYDPNNYGSHTLSMTTGTSLSGSFIAAGARWGSYQTPGTLTGASHTIQVSNDGVTWMTCSTVAPEANPYAAVSNALYVFPQRMFHSNYARILGNTDEGGTRNFIVMLKS